MAAVMRIKYSIELDKPFISYLMNKYIFNRNHL